MEKTSNEIKEQRFRYPDAKLTGIGRKLAFAGGEKTFWVAAQMEQSRRNLIILKKFSAGKNEYLVLGTSGYCHQPALALLPENRVAVVWNESAADGWKIQQAIVSGATPLKMPVITTIWQSEHLCLPPAAAAVDGRLVVVWPALDANNDICIFLWADGRPRKISAAGISAMRPALVNCGKEMIVAWDQYRENCYEIAIVRLRENTLGNPEILGRSGERWMYPALTSAGKSGGAFLCWLGLRELSDDLGVAEHYPFGMVAKIAPESGVEVLEDKSNRADPAIVADLREGLLAEHTYKGYLGLRRRPQITVSDAGEVYGCWEVRLESEKTAVAGHLVARKYCQDSGWLQPKIICSEGYGYTVPCTFSGATLPVAYCRFTEKEDEIIQATHVDPADGKPYLIDGTRWQRWRNSEIKPIEKPSETVKIDNDEYSLFWADTHCHSNFSADAEGEPDELIHFARDIAGLDAFCLIDNDYYPHKTLTEAEWRIHNAYAEYFTRPGQFVLFPGFEFTFHREDLSPDFNHRCVIYPRPGGKLLRRIDPGSRTDHELLAGLRQTDAMAYPHHCSYEIIDPAKEWNIEALSSWRVCLAESDFTIRQLQAGFKLGFIGSSDAHRSNPGLGGALTGIFARELTPESLFDAYRNRRLIATQGFAVFIDFRVADVFMGEESECCVTPVATAKIIAPEPIEYVEVIRDGESVVRIAVSGKETEFEFKDETVARGRHFYFLKLKLAGDPGFNFSPHSNSRLPFTLDSRYPHNLAKARGVFAWTSPSWITVK